MQGKFRSPSIRIPHAWVLCCPFKYTVLHPCHTSSIKRCLSVQSAALLQILASVDANRDGRVDYEEFCTMMRMDAGRGAQEQHTRTSTQASAICHQLNQLWSIVRPRPVQPTIRTDQHCLISALPTVAVDHC